MRKVRPELATHNTYHRGTKLCKRERMRNYSPCRLKTTNEGRLKKQQYQSKTQKQSYKEIQTLRAEAAIIPMAACDIRVINRAMINNFQASPAVPTLVETTVSLPVWWGDGGAKLAQRNADEWGIPD